MTRRRRIGSALATILVAAVLLLGCSTGNAPEAERGQQQDAQRESVITDLQATYTWDMVNSTPDSTPDETPDP